MVAFYSKEYVVTVSSLLQNDFGVARWDFETQISIKCWFSSNLKLALGENHTVADGYDLSIIWYEVYVVVSVFKLNSAKIFIIDASDMLVKLSPGFLSLAGRGAGRIDTFSETFQEFKMLTCVVITGTLFCETMNYLTGASIQTMSQGGDGSSQYDPALSTMSESKFYLVATEKKFYVGKAATDST